MSAARSLGRPRRYGIFVVAAVLALLQPLLTPLAPQLAGWLPGHQHVYVNGVPVDHAHPWDDAAENNAVPDGATGGYIVHLCDIHPDGRVPVAPSSSTNGTASPTGNNAETDAGEVVFTFDLGVSAVTLPGLNADLAPCVGALVLAPQRAVSPLAAPGERPVPPPPQA